MNQSKSEKDALTFFKKNEKHIQNIYYFIFSILVILGIVYLFSIVLKINNNSNSSESNEFIEENSELANNDSCSVRGIELRGSLLTYIPKHAEGDYLFNYNVTSSEDVVWFIENANKDDNIKAIIIEVDSGGGSPVAGEEIAEAIKRSEKPVISFVRDVGASSSYLSISSSDKIFASKNSDIGGIGVTASYLSNVKKNKNEGYEYQELIAGKYKDYGSPDKELSAEERALFLRDLNIIHANFMKSISINRNIPLEKVRSFADGSTVLGERAKELGLIDEIGGLSEVREYIKNQINEEVKICW